MKGTIIVSSRHNQRQDETPVVLVFSRVKIIPSSGPLLGNKYFEF